MFYYRPLLPSVRNILVAIALSSFSIACDSKSGGINKELLLLGAGLQNDKVGDSLTSAFDSVSTSMEGLSGEGASVAMQKRDSGIAERLTSSFERMWNRGPGLGELSAYNVSFDCWGGGDYGRQTVSTGATNYDFIDYILDNNDKPSSSFFVSKSFQDCKFLPFTSWTIDGKAEHIWSGLSSSEPFVQTGTVLQIGIDRSLENSSRGRRILTKGTGADLSYGAGTPSTKQAYSLSWTSIGSGISGYSQDVSVTREGYSGENLIYSHSVTSLSSLQYGAYKSGNDFTAWYRLWLSGSLQVVHSGSENFTLVTSVDDPVKWRYIDCLPKSGKVSFTISGDLNGSGSVNFSDGNGNYTYTYTDADGNTASSSGSIDFSSCSVPLLIL